MEQRLAVHVLNRRDVRLAPVDLDNLCRPTSDALVAPELRAGDKDESPGRILNRELRLDGRLVDERRVLAVLGQRDLKFEPRLISTYGIRRAHKRLVRTAERAERVRIRAAATRGRQPRQHTFARALQGCAHLSAS
jgi:hypothetical protein